MESPIEPDEFKVGVFFLAGLPFVILEKVLWRQLSGSAGIVAL